MPLAGGTPIALASNLCGADGIAVDSSNVYVGVSGNGSVLEIPIAGGAPIIHTVAEFGVGPVAVDASNVYWLSLSSNGSHVVVSKSPIGAPSPTVLTPSLFATGSTACGQSAPILAVDSINVYWTVESANITLMKMPTGGGSPVALAVLVDNAQPGVNIGAFATDAENASTQFAFSAMLERVPLVVCA